METNTLTTEDQNQKPLLSVQTCVSFEKTISSSYLKDSDESSEFTSSLDILTNVTSFCITTPTSFITHLPPLKEHSICLQQLRPESFPGHRSPQRPDCKALASVLSRQGIGLHITFWRKLCLNNTTLSQGISSERCGTFASSDTLGMSVIPKESGFLPCAFNMLYDFFQVTACQDIEPSMKNLMCIGPLNSQNSCAMPNTLAPPVGECALALFSQGPGLSQGISILLKATRQNPNQKQQSELLWKVLPAQEICSLLPINHFSVPRLPETCTHQRTGMAVVMVTVISAS